MESAVSGHKVIYIRERLADKLELIRFDPYSKYVCYMTGINSVVQWLWVQYNLHEYFVFSSYPYNRDEQSHEFFTTIIPVNVTYG
jgi:hypothetical protein